MMIILSAGDVEIKTTYEVTLQTLHQPRQEGKVIFVNLSCHYEPLFITFCLLATSFLKLPELANKSQALIKCPLDKATPLGLRVRAENKPQEEENLKRVSMRKGKHLVSYFTHPHKTVLVKEKSSLYL